ncbi:MAG: hypothetical protein Kow0068_01050 [Marinilabiliales bacterium]
MDLPIKLTNDSKTLKSILADISNETGVTFSYNPEKIPEDSMVSFPGSTLKLFDFLTRLFPPSKYNIQEIENVIVITRNENKQSSIITISGKVAYEKTKDPIPNTSVYIKNSSHGTISDANGEFILELPEKYSSDTLIISALGYKKFICPVNYFFTDNKILVLLEDSVYMLDELSIIAYNHITDAYVKTNENNSEYVLSFITDQYSHLANYIKHISENFGNAKITNNTVTWKNVDITGIDKRNINIKLTYSICKNCPFNTDIFVYIEVKKDRSNLLFNIDRKKILISKLQNILNLSLSEGIDINQLIIKNNTAYQRDSEHPYTGPCFSYYKSNIKAISGYYKNGIREGVWEWWFPNGQLGKKAYYNNGKPNYTSSFWYKNGNKKLEVQYVDGVKNGKLIYWYNNGSMRLQASFKNDKLDGLYEFWFKNGQIAKKAVYQNGILISAIEWNKRGKIIKRVGNNYIK